MAAPFQIGRLYTLLSVPTSLPLLLWFASAEGLNFAVVPDAPGIGPVTLFGIQDTDYAAFDIDASPPAGRRLGDARIPADGGTGAVVVGAYVSVLTGTVGYTIFRATDGTNRLFTEFYTRTS